MCVMGLPWLRSVTESPHVSTGIQSYSEHYGLLIESSRGRSDGVNPYIICIAMARRVKCDAVLERQVSRMRTFTPSTQSNQPSSKTQQLSGEEASFKLLQQTLSLSLRLSPNF